MAENKGLFPGWLPHLGNELSVPGVSGPRGGFPGWLYRTGSIGSAPTSPSIGSVTTPALYDSTITVTGNNFGAVQGTVFIESVEQTVLTWSDTQVTFTCDRGDLRYGNYILYLYPDGGGVSTSSITLESAIEGRWVTLVDPLAPPDQRITATPDLVAGDQVAWGGYVGTGYVYIRDDGTFYASDTIISFWVEVNDGTGWSTKATQTLGIPAGTGIANFRLGGSWAPLDYPSCNINDIWTTPYASYIKTNGVWEKFYPEENVPPVCELLLPGSGDYVAGLTILKAKAIDDSSVVNVKFYRDSAILLGTVTTHSNNIYELPFDFSTLTNGSYSIYCTALDDTALETTTTPITITVDNNLPPIVAITYPNTGQVFYADYFVSADASDPNPFGTVANVKLYENGVQFGSTLTSPPYTWNVPVSAKSPGRYNYYAVATDNAGAQTTSAAVYADFVVNAAPVLSGAFTQGPLYSAANGHYGYFGVATDTNNGTLYFVLTTNSSTPTAVQIRSGRDGLNAVGTQHEALPVTSDGFKAILTPNLNDGTIYYGWWAHWNSSGVPSNITGSTLTIPADFSVLINKSTLTGVNNVSSSTSMSGPVTVVTDSVTLTITGGVGTVTTNIEKISGTSASMSSTGTNQYAFYRTATASEGTPVYLTGVYRFVVQDSTGKTAYSANFTVNTTHIWTYIDIGG